MKDLIQKTIAKLKEDKIKPLPKWRFILLDLFYWALVALASIFSVVAAATGIYLLFQIDWEAFRYGSPRSLGLFFLYVPYVWLMVVAALMMVVFYLIRKTKDGYKYKWIIIALSFLSLVIALGAAAHFVQIGKITDEFAYKKMPFYKDFVPGMEQMWQRAEDGFLAGKIVSIKKDKLELVDLNKQKWSVMISEETVIRGPLELESDSFVKIIGKMQKDGLFNAKVIIVGKGKMMRGLERLERDAVNHSMGDGFDNKMGRGVDDLIMNSNWR